MAVNYDEKSKEVEDKNRMNETLSEEVNEKMVSKMVCHLQMMRSANRF